VSAGRVISRSIHPASFPLSRTNVRFLGAKRTKIWTDKTGAFTPRQRNIGVQKQIFGSFRQIERGFRKQIIGKNSQDLTFTPHLNSQLRRLLMVAALWRVHANCRCRKYKRRFGIGFTDQQKEDLVNVLERFEIAQGIYRKLVNLR
jgi:hypothetical protein